MRSPAFAGVPIDGFLSEEIAPPGPEPIVGGSHDPSFGSMIMPGLGGVFGDDALRLCPIAARAYYA